MITRFIATFIIMAFALLGTMPVSAAEIQLDDLIKEALENNPVLLASSFRTEALRHRIPQAGSLPDPMITFGYQNEGYERYTYGEMIGAQWIYSVSQMFPFPGKLSLKEDMALFTAEGQHERYRDLQLKTALRIKELYFDLLLAHGTKDLLGEKIGIFEKIESVSLARYATGTGMQQDALMAQTEKYMLHEREEMLMQKIEALEAFLNAAAGRDSRQPLGTPAKPAPAAGFDDLDALLLSASENSPELHTKTKMIEAAEAKLRLSEKDYYPDFTVSARLMERKEPFEDMWSITTSFNIPLFHKSKQKEAVREAEALLAESKQDYQSARLAIMASVRENYSQKISAERLMDLYRDGLLPKATQEFQAALAAYETGKGGVAAAIDRLKAVVDTEIFYLNQFVVREKAIARLEALTASTNNLIAGSIDR